MIAGGDELGRTQGGNNNAWCQDNEISWFDWELDEPQRGAARVHAPAARAAARAPGLPPHAVPRRQGPAVGAPRRLVVPARRPADGRRDWQNGDARALGVFLNGEEIGSVDDARASRSSTLVRCCSLNAHPRTSSSRCRRVASGRAGRWSSRPRTRHAAPSVLHRARRRARARALAAAAAGARPAARLADVEPAVDVQDVAGDVARVSDTR